MRHDLELTRGYKYGGNMWTCLRCGGTTVLPHGSRPSPDQAVYLRSRNWTDCDEAVAVTVMRS